MKDLYIIKDRLNEALKFRDMTASQLAKKASIDKGSVSRYLTGETIPRSGAIAKMAEALNINPAWLIGYDVPMVESEDPRPDLVTEKDGLSVLIEAMSPKSRGRLLDFARFIIEQEKKEEEDGDSEV